MVDPTTGVLYLTDVRIADDFCGLARSDDNGLTRRCLPTPGGRLLLDPAVPGTLWMLSEDDLEKSTDRGEHWTQIQPHGLENAGFRFSLAIDPVHSGVLYMGTGHLSGGILQRVWRSSDGGHHWSAWGSPMPLSWTLTDLLIDPQEPAILYAAVADYTGGPAAHSGVYWSRNGGRTFQPLRDGLPGLVQQLIQDPANPRVLYATTPNDGIYTFTRSGR